ncbi:uncharacterized protein BDZ99DRAFT_483509 [Mytilinidion resinicola]|uniref:Uncharacterized protein n=1 Tax=Mytilinidion resinicola TaxID=574789 RepID=A0A6A6XYZ4_9PEZI|nr:uncharacterized protein BDZ99DRAFT_483509 [Mytilinidion resinicola]KAF2801722.1 hypothetical protein BDZ99DRAFT_483509 [Mytilinidion resinicola]
MRWIITALAAISLSEAVFTSQDDFNPLFPSIAHSPEYCDGSLVPHEKPFGPNAPGKVELPEPNFEIVPPPVEPVGTIPERPREDSTKVEQASLHTRQFLPDFQLSPENLDWISKVAPTLEVLEGALWKVFSPAIPAVYSSAVSSSSGLGLSATSSVRLSSSQSSILSTASPSGTSSTYSVSPLSTVPSSPSTSSFGTSSTDTASASSFLASTSESSSFNNSAPSTSIVSTSIFSTVETTPSGTSSLSFGTST